jgi:hypothetical protein
MLIEEGRKFQDKSLIRSTNGAGKEKSSTGKDKSASAEKAS